jgi:general secretion pathway protein A
MLWKESQGVPRHLHLIMDRCLYGLAAKNGNVIDASLMKQAIDDSRLDLVGPVRIAAPPLPAARFKRTWVALASFVGIALVGGAAWTKVAPSAGVSPPAQVSSTANSKPTEITGEILNAAGIKPAETKAEHQATTVSTEAIPSPVTDVSLASPTLVEPASVLVSASASGETSKACSLQQTLPSDHKVVSQPLPELTTQLLGSRLARWGDACLQTRQDQQWLTWSTPLSGFDMAKPFTAARFQMALTQYGSLLPTEVDGIWGARSQGALKQFQLALGLSATGDVDALSGLLLERFYVQER